MVSYGMPSCCRDKFRTADYYQSSSWTHCWKSEWRVFSLQAERKPAGCCRFAAKPGNFWQKLFRRKAEADGKTVWKCWSSQTCELGRIYRKALWNWILAGQAEQTSRQDRLHINRQSRLENIKAGTLIRIIIIHKKTSSRHWRGFNFYNLKITFSCYRQQLQEHLL